MSKSSKGWTEKKTIIVVSIGIWGILLLLFIAINHIPIETTEAKASQESAVIVKYAGPECILFHGTRIGESVNLSGDLAGVKVKLHNGRIVGAIASKDDLVGGNGYLWVRTGELLNIEAPLGGTYNFVQWVVDDPTAKNLLKQKECKFQL